MSIQILRSNIILPAVIADPGASALLAPHMMSSKGISQLPVVSSDNRADLIGDLRKKGILAAYDKAVLNREVRKL